MEDYPSSSLANADQSKANVDKVLSRMIKAAKCDLADSVDPTILWLDIATSMGGESDRYQVAAVCSAAILRLAKEK